MDIFEGFATDVKKETEGAEVKIGPDAFITVARTGNRKYARLLSKRFESSKDLLDSETDDADDESDKIMIEVLAETILLGWRGLSFKGKKVTYTKENAKKLLAVKDFRQRVITESSKFEHYRVTSEEETKEK